MKEKVGICVIAIVLSYAVWSAVLAMKPSKAESFNYSCRVIENAIPQKSLTPIQVSFSPASEMILLGPYRPFARFENKLVSLKTHKGFIPVPPISIQYGPYFCAEDESTVWD